MLTIIFDIIFYSLTFLLIAMLLYAKVNDIDIYI